MQYRSRSRQGGFTLVEIAIVLVIIGLLLGGVLKGQELIENGKVKNLKNDFQGVAAAFYSYRDRYNATPGDDVSATTAIRGWAGSVAGNGNGVVAAVNTYTVCAAGTGGEQCTFWRHLRHTGLIAGNINNSNPQNAYGGTIAITQSAGATTGVAAGLNICMGNLPGKAAAAIDSSTDDGNPATGNVRGVAVANNGSPYAAAPATGGYNETATFTVCKVL